MVLGDLRAGCAVGTVLVQGGGRCSGLAPASLPGYSQGPYPINKPFQSLDLLSSGVPESQVTGVWVLFLSLKTQAHKGQKKGGREDTRDKPGLPLAT